jgi:hypothetical protein
VRTVLGVPVCRFEDGTAPRQVDALVHYPDRLAALEIVTDPDKDSTASRLNCTTTQRSKYRASGTHGWWC